ncbi:MAG: fused MFS/spermidine synthase [Planctomycetes bacterium]|nr:fused MFS/spermidine synthase [Planctomycetota bacterium]
MRRFAMVLVLAVLVSPLVAEEEIVYETNSLYHHIIVSQTPLLRILRFRKGPAEKALGNPFAQGIVSLEDPHELHMSYAKVAIVGAGLVKEPRRALFIGLGAGAIPKFFARAFPDCRCDVAEIDAKVVDVARRYFFFPELPNVHVTVMDGRMFLRRSEGDYDIIFLDAYRDQMIPFHLMTREFFKELKSKLSPQGFLVSNAAVKDTSQLYPWMLRTYQTSFGTAFEARVERSINKVLILWPGKNAARSADFVEGSKAVEKTLGVGFSLVRRAALYKDVSTDRISQKVLTDDYAPVNLMRLRKADEKDWEY